MSLNHQISIKTATALAFGIKTDTLGFTRDFNAVDLRALSWLNAFVDKDIARSIEIPPRSQETLESFSNALNNRMKIENNRIITWNPSDVSVHLLWDYSM